LSLDRDADMFAGFWDLFAWIPDWVGEWYFIVPLIVVLLALIGLLIFLRSRRSED
jgi:hypothetical protein